jgi:hypothetical protein
MPDEREPVGTDEKAKAAEGEEITFPNPHFDMTGSGITFTIYSGLPSGSTPTGDAGLIGGAAGSWPRIQVPRSGSPHGQEAHGGRSRPPSTWPYAPNNTPPTRPAANGNWNSGLLDDCQAAFATTAAHEHTVDRVEAITGPVGIPITGC